MFDGAPNCQGSVEYRRCSRVFQRHEGGVWKLQGAEGGAVNRAQLRQLAEDRILDAGCLLAGGRPAGAYYLAGYAVECGLKACILAHIEAAGAIFQDRKFSEKCWTHDLEE